MAVYPDRSTALVDVCGGREDLKQGLLRRVSAASLAEDSVRMLRAVRLLAQFDFTLDHATRVQIERLASAIRLASPERIRDELWKTLLTDKPDWALDEMQTLGLLAYVLPELASTIGVVQSSPHYQDVYRHTLATVREMVWLRAWIMGRPLPASTPAHVALSQTLEPWRFRLRHLCSTPIAVGRQHADWLIWYALLHDIGKPATRTLDEPLTSTKPALEQIPVRYRFLEHEIVGAEQAIQRLDFLRFSRQELAMTRTVITNHMRPHLLHTSFHDASISRRACYRFFRDVHADQDDSQAGLDTVVLALADYQAIYQSSPPPAWEGYLDHVRQLMEFAFEDDSVSGSGRQPLVNGHLLMQRLNLPPGRQIGQFLEQLMEAQVAGEISSTEEALQLASAWLHGQGPS